MKIHQLDKAASYQGGVFKC